MNYTYKQLEQELSALSKLFSELGARLSEVAKEVSAPGVMPSEKLLEQIAACRTNFENVRSAVHGHAGAMLVSPLPKLGELVSIATIDSLLKAGAIAEETKYSIESEREQALAILGRVLAITHRETTDFKPLQECQAKVSELRSAISNVTWPHRRPEAESVVAAKHPATVLLHFVENLDHIDDERWMTLETAITEAYGKPLFVAASRGKLAVPADPKPVAPEATEKPSERRTVAEKAPEKPAPATPPPSGDKKVAAPAPPPASTATEKTPQKPVTAPAPTQVTVQPAPEKKPTPQVAPAAGVSAPAAPPVAVLPAVLTAPPPSPAPAPAATAPAAATPAAPPRPPAPAPIVTPSVPPPPQVQAPIAASPVASASVPAPAAASNTTPAASPLSVTMNSLTALATATEPAEKKPISAPSDTAEKQRKEPRLATPVSHSVVKPELKPQDFPETAQQGVLADGSQRPQRWGFWRGNR